MPASYNIESLDWDVSGPEGGKIVVRLNLKVANQGKAGRETDTPVTASVNDGESSEVAVVPPLDGGESTNLIFDLRLDPGQQQVRINLDDSDSLVALDLLASDIVVTPLYYQVVAEGQVSFGVRVSNEGSRPTRPVQLISQNAVVAVVQPLESGDSEELTFTLDLEPGEQTMEVVAATDDREVNTENNTALVSVEVDYVSLSLTAGAANAIGFIRGGSARVSIDFNVSNIGVAPSGNFNVAVSCPESPGAQCEGGADVESLAPGESHSGMIEAVVPQGTSDIVLYAGELDDGYRWGDSNTVAITLDVPLQPDVDPVFEVQADLSGYYANGDAALDVSMSLRNAGAEPIPGEYPVAITCMQGETIVAACGGVVNINLEDGFGPVTASTVLRSPVGTVDLNLEVAEIDGVEEALSTTVQVAAPARIVGIDRALWNCFSSTVVRDDFPRGNCSGRISDTVSKWPSDEPVTVWINGLSAYREQLEDTLQEIAPQLNITYQFVPEVRRAAIAAYVGINPEQAQTLGFTNCDGFWGCTNYETDEDGNITSAEIVIFSIDDAKLRQLRLIDESVQYAILHSLLAVLVPLDYRDVPDSVMSVDRGLRFPVMSASDREIVRILTSPLVNAGDTTAEIEELVVFADEVLDPPEAAAMSNLDIVWRAREKLIDSGSALYAMRGGWSGGTCIDRFGTSQVTISEFAAHRGLYYRLTDASQQMYIFLRSEDGRAEYWDGASRGWRRFTASDEIELIDETAWSPQYSDPMTLLASVLWFGTDLLTEVERDEDTVSFRVERFRAYAAPTWTDRADVAASFAVDLNTFEIGQFAMDWYFDVRGLVCDGYDVEGDLIEYGVSLNVPSDVRERSRVID